ncbi:hypothetical protein C7Q95_01865 [Staphylococcus aureus]|nr:hypothetical protein C7J94_07615 [Staphylococcus aureus]PZH56804.1 hypothetical protein C7Q95_01865 [Staphylococcus aureus]PZJ20630.1 hypothetical protein C7Q07_07395 [Staphylococcus aureus]PZL14380.1 hypothetical protein C7Q32_07130 [Staphylococcus aureus]
MCIKKSRKFYLPTIKDEEPKKPTTVSTLWQVINTSVNFLSVNSKTLFNLYRHNNPQLKL